MSREIKFRAWDSVSKQWLHDGYSDMLLMDLDGSTYRCSTESCESPVRETRNTPTLSQYTGLKDKNGAGDICLYEGDILSLTGKIIGNIYENTELLQDESNFTIAELGTKNWGDAEKKAMDRGFGYAV